MTPISDQEFLILLARHLYTEANAFGMLAKDYQQMSSEGVKPEALVRRSEMVLSFQGKRAMLNGLFGRICHHLALNKVKWELEGPNLDTRYQEGEE